MEIRSSFKGGNLKESVLKEKRLSLEHLQLLDDKKYKHRLN